MNNTSIINIVVADYDMQRLMDIIQNIQLNPMLKVIGIAQSGKDAIDRAATMAADVVLMEYSMIDCTAKEVCEQLREDSPGTYVFAISDSASAQFVFSAKKAGIVEIFPREGFVAREAGEKIAQFIYTERMEFQRISQERGAVEKGTGPRGQKIVKEYITKSIPQSVILTYNTKGGVGKSATAINLAIAIKMSPYMSGQRVALVDFDCGGANISTVCHIPDADAINRNLAFWEGETDNLTAQEVDDLMIPGPHGVMVLPAPMNMVLAEKINFELCDKILNVLKRYFQIIVIDGAPNISAPIDAALRHATKVLLVANAEGQSVKQLARTIHLLSPNSDYPDKPDMTYLLNKMFVVLNHAQGHCKWDLKANEVARTIGRPLLAELPFSESVREALHSNSEKQAIELDSNGEYAVAIKKLANDLVGAYPEGVEQLPKSKHSSKAVSTKDKKGGFLGLFK